VEPIPATTSSCCRHNSWLIGHSNTNNVRICSAPSINDNHFWLGLLADPSILAAACERLAKIRGGFSFAIALAESFVARCRQTQKALKDGLVLVSLGCFALLEAMMQVAAWEGQQVRDMDKIEVTGLTWLWSLSILMLHLPTPLGRDG